MTRWVTVGSGASASAIGASQRIVVAGDDAELHDLVEALRGADHDAPAIPVRFPEDPSIDPSEPVRFIVALSPRSDGGLARTIGIRPDSPMARSDDDAVWGPLDIGIVTIDGAERVLVSHLDIGLDAQPRGMLGRMRAPMVSGSFRGRRPMRRGEPMTQHAIEAQPLGWIAIANGQYEGDARIAPRAVPHDRAFDLLLARGDLRSIRRMRRDATRAAHVPDRAIEERLIDAATLTFDRPVRLRLDDRWLTATSVSLRLERLGIALKV